ncbi:unnamed protein product, partial [Urochloa humidicola]
GAGKGEVGEEKEKRGKRKGEKEKVPPGKEAGAVRRSFAEPPPTEEEEDAERRGVPRAVLTPATPSSPPRHLDPSYDTEDYFDYYEHNYAGVVFNDEYNYNE